MCKYKSSIVKLTEYVRRAGIKYKQNCWQEIRIEDQSYRRQFTFNVEQYSNTNSSRHYSHSTQRSVESPESHQSSADLEVHGTVFKFEL